MNIIAWLGIAGFLICLFIMYVTGYGIKELRKYDENFRILDMRFHYTPTDVYGTFSKLGLDGRNAYVNFWILDFFFIICFFIVQVVLVKAIGVKVILGYALILFVIARSLFDVIENCLLIYLTRIFPRENIFVAKISSCITTSKFITLYLWSAGVIVALIRGALKW